MSERPLLGDCPICGAQLALPGNLIKGELLECDNCTAELEVIDLSPVELKAPPQAEEPWEE